MGYSSWGYKESDTSEQLTQTHTGSQISVRCHQVNYHKLSNLKPYTFIISLLLQVRSLGCLKRVLCKDATKVSPRAQPSGAMNSNKSVSLYIVTRISFSVAVTSRFLPSHWLLAGGHSQLLQAACSSLPPGSLHGFLTTWQMASSSCKGEKNLSRSIITEWQPITFAVLRGLETSHSPWPHSRRGALQGLDP